MCSPLSKSYAFSQGDLSDWDLPFLTHFYELVNADLSVSQTVVHDSAENGTCCFNIGATATTVATAVRP